DETAEFRERLIGIVSHDLRNPMSVIMMAATVLMRSPNADRQTIDKMVTRIYRSGERATAMIRDLLDFTQARLGGGIRIGRRPADLHAIVRQVVEETEVAHPERTFVLQHQGNAHGQWDADRLAQVISNLLSNAVTYSPSSTPIRITTEDLGDIVELAVHNEGAAIRADMQAHLFEPMQRASSELNNANRSVGLGLYIVKHIVDAHAGTVTVKSAEGEGTQLTIRLPRTAPV
ncbi:MAG: HAMP domain-containing histidine kinase, partial [Pseudomonas sp.]